MKKIRIGGVPEHFNLPWSQAVAEGMFAAQDLDLTWQDYPGGTGVLMADVEADKLDLAVVLTEGAVNAISKGNPSVIAGAYINSPLIWGIHVPAQSQLTKIEDIQDKTYAISRYGSGSHLMACVDAKARNWNSENLKFVEVKNIEGAREAFKSNQAQVFMWEKFMTKPLVDAGEFRLLGERPTPWPCFVIVARNSFYTANTMDVEKVLNVIYSRSKTFQNEVNSVKLVSKKFHLKEDDAAEWFACTRWADKPFLSGSDLQYVAESLYTLKLLNSKPAPQEFTVPHIIM